MMIIRRNATEKFLQIRKFLEDSEMPIPWNIHIGWSWGVG